MSIKAKALEAMERLEIIRSLPNENVIKIELFTNSKIVRDYDIYTSLQANDFIIVPKKYIDMLDVLVSSVSDIEDLVCKAMNVYLRHIFIDYNPVDIRVFTRIFYNLVTEYGGFKKIPFGVVRKIYRAWELYLGTDLDEEYKYNMGVDSGYLQHFETLLEMIYFNLQPDADVLSYHLYGDVYGLPIRDIILDLGFRLVIVIEKEDDGDYRDND